MVLDVVVGTGHHSFGGAGKLAPALLDWSRATVKAHRLNTGAAKGKPQRKLLSVTELASTDGRGGVIRLRIG